jgi:hypothetical protein
MHVNPSPGHRMGGTERWLSDDDEAERQEVFRIISVDAALTPHVNHLHHQHNHRQDEEAKDLGWACVLL